MLLFNCFVTAGNDFLTDCNSPLATSNTLNV